MHCPMSLLGAAAPLRSAPLPSELPVVLCGFCGGASRNRMQCPPTRAPSWIIGIVELSVVITITYLTDAFGQPGRQLENKFCSRSRHIAGVACDAARMGSCSCWSRSSGLTERFTLAARAGKRPANWRGKSFSVCCLNLMDGNTRMTVIDRVDPKSK